MKKRKIHVPKDTEVEVGWLHYSGRDGGTDFDNTRSDAKRCNAADAECENESVAVAVANTSALRIGNRSVKVYKVG